MIFTWLGVAGWVGCVHGWVDWGVDGGGFWLLWLWRLVVDMQAVVCTVNSSDVRLHNLALQQLTHLTPCNKHFAIDVD